MITVQASFGKYQESFTWVKKEYDPKGLENVVVGYDYNDDKDNKKIIAKGDIPFVVQYWDVDNDECLFLTWDGQSWTTEIKDEKATEKFEAEYNLAVLIDALSLEAATIQKLGFGFVSSEALFNKMIHVDLINRENPFYNIPSSDVNSYYYNDVNMGKGTSTYKTDLGDVSLAELNYLYSSTGIMTDRETTEWSDEIAIYYDCEETPLKAVQKLFDKDDKIFQLLSETSDIIDMEDMANEFFSERGDVAGCVVSQVDNENDIHRFYVNLGYFHPEHAIYLS